NDAVAIHDERHDSSRIVLRRPGDEREPARHPAADEIVLRPSLGGCPLTRQDLEVIPVKRRRFRVVSYDRRAFLGGARDEIAERTPPRGARGGPVEAVLLPGLAPEGRRVHARRSAVVSMHRIDLLCYDVCPADEVRRQLVAADAPVEDFLPARARVEAPGAAVL